MSLTYLVLHFILDHGILVSREPQTPPKKATKPSSFDKTPFKTKQEFDSNLNRKLDSLRPRMRELVQRAEDVSFLIPSWRPGPDFDQSTAEFLSGLQIPDFPVNQPNLLLHNLGEVKTNMDRERQVHMQNIFHLSKTMYVISGFDHLAITHLFITACLSTPVVRVKPVSC
jgi:hypothetical protein